MLRALNPVMPCCSQVHDFSIWYYYRTSDRKECGYTTREGVIILFGRGVATLPRRGVARVGHGERVWLCCQRGVYAREVLSGRGACMAALLWCSALQLSQCTLVFRSVSNSCVTLGLCQPKITRLDILCLRDEPFKLVIGP